MIWRVLAAAAIASVAACGSSPEGPRPASAFGATMPNDAPAPVPAPAGMVWIPGGEFSMGSDAAADALCDIPGVTLDAQPIHRVSVDGFWMDATEVTNEQFAAFATVCSMSVATSGNGSATGTALTTTAPSPLPAWR